MSHSRFPAALLAASLAAVSVSAQVRTAAVEAPAVRPVPAAPTLAPSLSAPSLTAPTPVLPGASPLPVPSDLPSPRASAVPAPVSAAPAAAARAAAAGAEAAGRSAGAVAAEAVEGLGAAKASAGPAQANGEVERVLSEIFDGSRERPDPAAGIFARIEPEVYGKDRVADARYASLLGRAWTGLSAQAGPGRPESPLLERMRAADAPTHAHMMRVALLTSVVARQMGHARREAVRMAWAAAMHDIGKMEPDILAAIRKPGKLSPEERVAVDRHPAEGARILEGQEGLDPALKKLGVRVALSHHEKFDGTGYPNRLKGADIPLESRIIAVADVFDALMEDRPYRPGMAWEKALSIMAEMAPAHFDPAVFRAFLEVSRREASVLEPAAP